MTLTLIISITATFLAFIFYSTGVWSFRFNKQLKPIHLVEFWIGLVLDTIGTICMSILAGGFKLNLHGLVGGLALGLMFVNTIWATLVWYKKQDADIQKFKKFSLIVWIIWLIPFFSGMMMGMQ